MKKLVVLITVTTLFFAISCSKEKKHEEHDSSEKIAKTEYYCPMECEGDKTYADKDAKCPVCKMDLVEKKNEAQKEEHKEHDDSSH